MSRKERSVVAAMNLRDVKDNLRVDKNIFLSTEICSEHIIEA